jgi:acetolactate decarboxylase
MATKKSIHIWILFGILIIAAWLLGSVTQAGAQQGQTKNAIFQVSTLAASLGASDYEGKITISELKKHGDFGIGTFDGLDGEMVGLDGQFYLAKADGIAYPVEGSMRTPFFQPYKTFSPDKSMN